MKELLKKKSVKIAIVSICFVVVAMIAGIVVQGNQEQQEIVSHLELAQKYLSDLDYEQAIVEYTAILEIEPNNETVINILEQTWLNYAQSYLETKEYQKAIEILERGFAQTQQTSLEEMLTEAKYLLSEQAEAERLRQEETKKAEENDRDAEQIVTFDFEITDFRIRGYDVLEDHMEDIADSFSDVIISDAISDYFDGFQRERYEIKGPYNPTYLDIYPTWPSIMVEFGPTEKGCSLEYEVYCNDDVPYGCGLRCFCDKDFYSTYKKSDLSVYINSPIMVGDPFETVERLFQIEKVKSVATNIDGGLDKGGVKYFFQTEWGEGWYLEYPADETGEKACHLMIPYEVIESAILRIYTDSNVVIRGWVFECEW